MAVMTSGATKADGDLARLVDVDRRSCEGALTGTLSAGGEWEGKCKQDEAEWEASISWKLDG